MSNPMVLAMHARGLGALGLSPFEIGGGAGGDFDGGSGGGWYQNWGGQLINQAGSILTGIFGNRNQQQPLYYPQTQQYPQGSTPYGAPPAQQVGSGLAQAWQDLASMFGISSSTLSLIALGGGVLLFMPPPRRRNPARRSNPKRRGSAKRRRSRRR